MLFRIKNELTTKNCLIVTVDALSLGKLGDGKSVEKFLGSPVTSGEIIPNSAKILFEANFYNTAYTLNDYSKQLNKKLDSYQSNWFTRIMFYQNIKDIKSLLSGIN